MNPDQKATAETCLRAACDGSLSFPEIIGKLITAGFESYTVDYRRNSQIFYLPSGDSIELQMPLKAGGVASVFDAAGVEAQVRAAQANAADYTYAGFSEKVKAHGCAGYLVSFLGRRVVYFGRSAETHVEHFPQ